MTVLLWDEISLGNRILDKVLQEFDTQTKYLKSGIPITRSNGVQEWTVLASIVMIDETGELTVLTLTTGVKAIPAVKLNGSDGLIIHDLHAEILSLRAFNYLILVEIGKIQLDNKDSFLLTKDLKFRPGLKFLMYISEPPCGDLSMELLNGGESWKRKNDGEMIRGRSNFNEVGIIRTKPGRLDSLISLSKSCSDKLCSRQYYGFCNSITAYLLDDNFKLDYLILHQLKINELSLERCFKERYNGIKVELINVLPTSIPFKYGKQPGKKPSDLSLVMVFNDNWVSEVIGNNGLKNGRSKITQKNASMISNANMSKDFLELIPLSISKYSDFQKMNLQRQDAKKFIRNDVLKNDWISNYKDDFYIRD